MARGDEEHTNSKTSYTAEEVKAHFMPLKEAQKLNVSQEGQEKQESLIRSPFQPGQVPEHLKGKEWVVEHPDPIGTFTEADLREGEIARGAPVARTPDGKVMTPNDIVEALLPKDAQESVTSYAQETTQINVDGLSNHDYAGNAKAVFSASSTNATDAQLTEQVREMQRMIGVKDDGLIGPNTKAALMEWQKQNPEQSIAGMLGKNSDPNVVAHIDGPLSIREMQNDPNAPDWAKDLEMVTGVFPGSPNGANKIEGLPKDVLAQVNAIKNNDQNFAVAQADGSSVSGQNVTDARDPNEVDAGRSFS